MFIIVRYGTGHACVYTEHKLLINKARTLTITILGNSRSRNYLQDGTCKVMISLLRWLFVMDKKFAYFYQVFAVYAYINQSWPECMQWHVIPQIIRVKPQTDFYAMEFSFDYIIDAIY